jgi:hypothetical protein
MVSSVLAARSAILRSARLPAAASSPPALRAAAVASNARNTAPCFSTLVSSTSSRATLTTPFPARFSTSISSKRAFSISATARAAIVPSVPNRDENGYIPLDKIRTVAVIAHVDHGKTTLVGECFIQYPSTRIQGKCEGRGGRAGSVAYGDRALVSSLLPCSTLSLVVVKGQSSSVREGGLGLSFSTAAEQ